MRKSLLTATASLGLLMGLAQPSHASLMMSISDGSTTQTLNDIGATGVLSFNSALGIFTTNVVTALSYPVIGTLAQPVIDLNSVDVANRDSHGGTLTISETETGLTGKGGTDWFLNSIGGTLSSGGAMAINTYLDCGNTAFGTGTHLTSQSFGSGAFSGEASADASVCDGSYSLTQIETINLAAGGFYSGDSTLAVPEPSTLATFGAGVLFLFGFGWLRRHGTMV